MPTYDYECAPCRHRFEVFDSISAPTRRICPRCGRRRARRCIGTGAGFVFKGSGFHVTDYRSAPAPKAETKAPAPEKA